MAEYTVTWEIQVDAETAHEAAEAARQMFERRGSIAHVFGVQEVNPFAPYQTGEAEVIDLDYKQCPNCEDTVHITDPLEHGMCEGCLHDAYRSGWEPGIKEN